MLSYIYSIIHPSLWISIYISIPLICIFCLPWLAGNEYVLQVLFYWTQLPQWTTMAVATANPYTWPNGKSRVDAWLYSGGVGSRVVSAAEPTRTMQLLLAAYPVHRGCNTHLFTWVHTRQLGVDRLQIHGSKSIHASPHECTHVSQA